MSRHNRATPDVDQPLGAFLREQREERKLSLWQVAAQAEMDSTLLSKIELGHRLPTKRQAELLANFFQLPIGEVEGRRIVESFWREHANNPSVGEAVLKLQETAPAHIVNKSVNKR